MNVALVLDGQLKSALSAARALGEADIKVVAAAERSLAMTLHSKYVDQNLVYPSPKDDQESFINFLKEKLVELNKNTGERVVVYTFSDATTLSIISAYDELKDLILFPLSSAESIEQAFDKAKTAELAETLNIPTIPTLNFDERHEFQYPVVVKNRRSVIWIEGKAESGTADFAFTPQEVREKYLAIEKATGEAPLIQTLVVGAEYGVEMMCADGEILQSFAHKRIRSLTPLGGAAVVKETAADTPEVGLMRQYATQIVKKLRWTGPVMVEFKYDNNTHSVRLMEVNGRFWGSLPLAQAAGVNFVLGYFKWVTSGVVPEPEALAPRHTRTYHYMGDLKWLLTVLFKRDKLRQRLYPSRTQALLDFGWEMVRGRSDVFSLKDPMPSYFETLDILKCIRK